MKQVNFTEFFLNYFYNEYFFHHYAGMGSYVAPKKRKMETMIPKGMEEQEDITEEVERKSKRATVQAHSGINNYSSIPSFDSVCQSSLPT